ncbi:MAG: SoxR reducing system RseC family protein [Bacteroidales bacterium]|jgi:sigma-E factor negative regulatory protein RseC
MESCKYLESDGIVTEVTNETIIVQIQVNSACGSCMSKNLCGMTESAKKNVIVNKKNGGKFGESIYDRDIKVGDMVKIGITHSTGMKSAFLAYFIPFVIFIAALLIMLQIFQNDLLAFGIGILFLAVYFVILKILRPKINKKIKFYIEK